MECSYLCTHYYEYSFISVEWLLTILTFEWLWSKRVSMTFLFFAGQIFPRRHGQHSANRPRFKNFCLIFRLGFGTLCIIISCTIRMWVSGTLICGTSLQPNCSLTPSSSRYLGSHQHIWWYDGWLVSSHKMFYHFFNTFQ